MAEKRAKRTLEEAQENKVNEALRRKAGKVRVICLCDSEIFTNFGGKDMNKIKEDLKLKEAIKEAEAKKRGIYLCWRTSDHLLISRLEKIDDAKARAAVKAQIEADKRARAEKAAREKALRDGQPVPESSSSTGPSRPAASTTVAKKDFAETRLAIRLASGGQQYTTTLPSDARTFMRCFP